MAVMVDGKSDLQCLFKSNGQCFHANSDYLFVSIVIIIHDSHAKQSVRLLVLLALYLDAGVLPGQGSRFFLLP